jgi:SAM-dependent methyltransferase
MHTGRIRDNLIGLVRRFSPKVPFANLNVVCREIIKLSRKGTILDVGCGDGKNTKLIAETIGVNFQITGLDASLGNINHARKSEVYRELVLADLNEPLPFSNKTFDVVILLNVLEHLPKDEGHKLLPRLEAVSRKGVIISTPGFLGRARRGTEAEDVAYQLERYENEPNRMPHLSVWTQADYRRHGYAVRRVSGVHIPHLPFLLSLVVGVLSAPCAYAFFPYLPAALVATKTTLDVNEQTQ